MDHHRSYNRSSSKKERDDNGGHHRDNKHFKPNPHRHESGPVSWQSSLSPQCLSTRKVQYERDFPVYKQPIEVGCFSLDSERRFFNDSRQIRYYIEPDKNPHFDLRDGYKDRYIKRDDSVREKLDHMLHWILANRSKLSSTGPAASSR